MSREITFKSEANANRRYVVSDDSMMWWDQAYHSSGRALCTWAASHDTLGDGNTQHTPNRVLLAHDFRDFCASAAAHIIANPADGEVFASACIWGHSLDSKRIDFVRNATWKEGKDRYASVAECKISSSPAKRHDKRYYRIEKEDDGSLKAIMFRLHMGEDGYMRGLHALELYQAARAIRDRIASTEDTWLDHPCEYAKLEMRSDDGYSALDCAIQSYRQMDFARRQLECYRYNAKSRAEYAAIG